MTPNRFFKNQKILITAGGTREPIDPVRYIGNRSSGKMGCAMAEAALQAGAKVTLVFGAGTAVPPKKVNLIKAETADDMARVVLRELPHHDILIMTAAVADWRPKKTSKSKIKKDKLKKLSLHLVPTTDILQAVSKKRKKGQYIVGFAAETEKLIENAVKKINRKKCDMIIANNVRRQDIGLGSEFNEVTVITEKGELITIPRSQKIRVARRLLKIIYRESSSG